MARYGDVMRTTLKIDDDVLERVRLIAHAEGRGIGAVLSDLVRRILRTSTMRYDDGFPVFDVPKGSPPITADDVAR